MVIIEMHFTCSSNTMLLHRQCRLNVGSLSVIFRSLKIYDRHCHFHQTNWVHKGCLELFSYRVFFLHSFRPVIQLFLVNIPPLTPLSTSWLLYDSSLMREITNQVLGCKYDSKMLTRRAGQTKQCYSDRPFYSPVNSSRVQKRGLG